MTQITRQRCFNHPRREAVARCPECGRYYCRECVIEHEDKVVCASCLAKITARGPGTGGRRWVVLLRGLQFLCALLLLWVIFYIAGQALLAIPSSFHEGALWTESTMVD